MDIDSTGVLVIGGGQAGIAMSEHLGRRGIEHLVVERGRIAERWRSERWDSLVANGPAWHDRFPGMEYPGCAPDDFPGKEAIADYFCSYAAMVNAPVRTGVEVTSVSRLEGRPGFLAATTSGGIEARSVVVATGPFQKPVIPAVVPAGTGVFQIHSSGYRNPAQLPDGGVLVVGGGSSGAQIAEELLRAGRRVHLSLGAHGRPPRSYRGRDFVWWLGVLDKWDAETEPGSSHTTIAVSGADGGRTVDFRRLAGEGLVLVGTTLSCEAGVVRFAPDLADNLATGDADYLGLLDEADAWVERNGFDLPPEPGARVIGGDPDCVRNPVGSLDLAAEGVTSIVWATGFALDYSWLKVRAADESGRPVHRRGISAEPGVYFLGLPWQTRRGSSFIWGVWHDASYVADHIVKQRAYLAYPPAGPSR